MIDSGNLPSLPPPDALDLDYRGDRAWRTASPDVSLGGVAVAMSLILPPCRDLSLSERSSMPPLHRQEPQQITFIIIRTTSLNGILLQYV